MSTNGIKDFWFWYKQFGPKYGYFWSIEYSIFNAWYFNRDGNWKRNTSGDLNETQ
jgi:hypothetical protein